MTSPYLTLPLRSEREARIHRAVKGLVHSMPSVATSAAEGSQRDLELIANMARSRLNMLQLFGEAGYRELYGPQECIAPGCDADAEGLFLCHDCSEDEEAAREREREQARNYRGPRYWRSL